MWMSRCNTVLMDLRSDFPFWTVRNGLLNVFPPLEADIRCDALVVGAGITGAIVADTLASAGVDTVVVDRRDVGHGSTSASTALLQYEIDEPLHRLKKMVGRSAAERAYRLGVKAIQKVEELSSAGDCGLMRAPSLYVARRKRDVPFLKREFAARRDAGLRVALMSRSDLTSEFGMDREMALWSADAASIDPYRLTHHLFRRWRKNGVRVFDRTEVTGFESTRSGVLARTNRRGTVRCRRLFLATGYEAQELFQDKLVTLRSTYALVSEPQHLSWWKKPCLIWETGQPYLYARQTPDNRVITGGEDDAVLNPGRRDAQTHAKSTRIRRKFEALFPGSSIEPAFWWSGVFGSTKDGLPFIGSHPSFPNCYFALGFGGNGITFSVMAAWIVRDLFLGKRPADAEIFRFSR